MQNIPSHNKEIRSLFKARQEIISVSDNDTNVFEINSSDDVNTNAGWKKPELLKVGDLVQVDDDFIRIVNIEKIDARFKIYI